MSKISSKIKTKTYGDQYMKLFMLHFLKKRTFLQELLDKYKNNQNEPQFISSEVKVVLKKWLWNKGYMHKW